MIPRFILVLFDSLSLIAFGVWAKSTGRGLNGFRFKELSTMICAHTNYLTVSQVSTTRVPRGAHAIPEQMAHLTPLPMGWYS